MFFEPELKHVPPLVDRADMQMNSLTLKLLVPQLRGLKSLQKRVKHITAREKRGEREKGGKEREKGGCKGDKHEGAGD